MIRPCTSWASSGETQLTSNMARPTLIPTTVASVIGVAEASLLMKEEIETFSDQIIAVFAIIAIGFMIITLTEGLVFGYLAKRLAVKR